MSYEENKKKKPYETEKPMPKENKVTKVIVTNCSAVNIRSEASPQAPVVRSVPVGTVLESVGTFGDWTKLFDGEFVMAKFVRVI